MNYRSLDDLNTTILRGMGLLPEDIDLIVGIPRSGLLAANLLSLGLNAPMADLEGFCEGRILSAGRTRRVRQLDRPPAAVRHALVIDDSISSGQSMRAARERVEAAGLAAKVTFAAVYGDRRHHPEVDFVFETVTQPRFFQWNILHHDILRHSCVDIDGVLCHDPTEAQNDDGENYAAFLDRAVPLFRPTMPIGRLVTSRLERYRGQTEAWLARQDIQYDELVMLDLPDAETRRRLGAHGSFKADVFRRSDALLFIESEHHQAEQIAAASGKPVLCTHCFELISPAAASLATLSASARTLPLRVRLKRTPLTDVNAMRALARRVLGDKGYAIAKKLAGRGQ